MSISRIRLAQAISALGFIVAFVAPAHAWDESRRGQPGTFETIMSIKLPGVYGPKLQVSPEVANKHYPVTGSFEAWQRAKRPWLFPTSAVSTGPICPAQQLRPGEFRTLMAIKMPSVYGPRNCTN